MAGAGVVLVTGGTGALGSAVVGDLLGAGYRVACTWLAARERDRLLAAVGEHDRLRLIEADLTDAGAAAEAVAEAAQGEHLDGLACLAGGFAAGGRLDKAPEGEFDRMIELNLITAQRACRAALPRLRAPGGSIVLVGARAGLDPFPGAAGYITAKAAVMALARALAADLRSIGVRVNSIVPDAIDTAANRESMPDADHESWPTPAEIAPVVRFLLSADSAPVSGAAVPVFGVPRS